MLYPKLGEQNVIRQFTQTFYGLDRAERIADGAWAFVENGTCDKFPAAATREHRRYVSLPENPRCFAVYRDGAADGSILYATIAKDTNSQLNPQPDRVFLNGTIVSTEISSPHLNDNEKHMVLMGQYLYILPKSAGDNNKPLRCDANNTNGTEYLSASVSITGSSGDTNVKFVPCTAEGEGIKVFYVLGAADMPEVSQFTSSDRYGIVDVSGGTPVFKQYSAILEDWLPVSQTYLKITQIGTGNGFAVDDYISIGGAEAASDSTSASKYNIEIIDSLNTADSVYRIAYVGENYIVIELNGAQIATVGRVDLAVGKTMTVEREVPLMDFVVAGNNRLWGCSSAKNEIYCCKLGDPKNWRSYAGLSTDSYAVTVGGERGPFTGAVFMGGCPVFFKENAAIMIYGTEPSNYQLVTISGNGVAFGSSKSVALVGNACYYLSQSGVRRFDGSNIEDVGGAVGKGHKNGVGAATGKKYYLTAQTSDNSWERLCYDVEKGLWMREDATPALFGASWGDFAAFVEDEKVPSSTLTGNIRVAFQTTAANVVSPGDEALPREDEGSFDWAFETGVIGYEDADEKYISRFNVRLCAEAGANIDVYIKYDSGEWEHKSSMTSYTRRSFTLPIRPRRCDHMQIRLAGHGDCVIYSIAKLYEKGSDVVR